MKKIKIVLSIFVAVMVTTSFFTGCKGNGGSASSNSANKGGLADVDLGDDGTLNGTEDAATSDGASNGSTNNGGTNNGGTNNGGTNNGGTNNGGTNNGGTNNGGNGNIIGGNGEDTAQKGNTTYYIDSVNGKDSNNGTSEKTPWKSLLKVNRYKYKAGDKILFKSGTTYIGTVSVKGSGTSGKPITIGKYGSGANPRIDAKGSIYGAVFLSNQEYITVENLEVTNNGGSAAAKKGMYILNDGAETLTGIVIQNCYIHDVVSTLTNYADGKMSGGLVFNITASGSKPAKWENVKVLNNTIKNVGREGILFQSAYINRRFTQDATFYGKNSNTGVAYKKGDYIPNAYWNGFKDFYPSTDMLIKGNTLEDIKGDGIIPWGFGKNSIVENNKVCKSNNNGSQGHVAIWAYLSDDVKYQFNEVCHTQTILDGMAFDFDNTCNNTVYQYNYSYENVGGWMNMCCDGYGINNTVRYNISANDGVSSGHGRVILVHGNGNINSRIYNNTVYIKANNPPLFSIGATTQHSSMYFWNNIFINEGNGGIGGMPYGTREFTNNILIGYNESQFAPLGSNVVKNNKWLANKSEIKFAKPSSIGVSGHNVTINDLSGYKLTDGSPALSGAKNVPDNGGIDFFKRKLPSNPFIGAAYK